MASKTYDEELGQRIWDLKDRLNLYKLYDERQSELNGSDDYRFDERLETLRWYRDNLESLYKEQRNREERCLKSRGYDETDND